ncbi:uncharacterized protein SPPG_07234 [Spizellomyces punctatus DAOM BR117]|uniref:ADF-H domain-containing protein n=1 Tax=Spizellomyces punctatus (strain DAOM BR117) TaxID=645134 RepID=A0A0L0H709_SPIPD|nr:uncharacterized protein SPPG_07234 [Spizellomyces punctatus DAOM BR117]KNC97305.1 hypothetical protein SPPG_07234 [Spizellomyces punctatus DAOM BR117]|eukprot:XP_016605345.1 hypothetical protein SPPG_07234 [Spizellomyces punctatus DAOM BR117]
MSTQVRLVNEAELTSAIRSVRDDKQPTNWVLVGHAQDGTDPNALVLVSTGEDGFEGLKRALSDDHVQYALLRMTNKVDLSTTVKFVYIYNFADKLSFAKKGRFGVVKGDATKYFMPFHVEIEIGSRNELIEEEVVKKIEAAAGNLNNVREADFIEGKQERGYTARTTVRRNSLENVPLSRSSTTSNTTGSTPNLNAAFQGNTGSSNNLHKSQSNIQKGAKPSAATQSQGVTLGTELLEAIKDLRNDKTPTKWVVGTYQDGNIANPIVLSAKGDGGAEEMKQKFAPDGIAYSLIRVTDFVDGHPTVKFAFVTFIGQQVGIMKKAKISTHKGGVTEHFAPYHVDFTISERREIDDTVIMNKVSRVSGSRSMVK